MDPMALYVAYSPNRHVTAKVRVFIDWVARLMAGMRRFRGKAIKSIAASA